MKSVASLVWALRVEGQSATQIAEELNQRGMPGPRTLWNKQAVAYVLRRTAGDFIDAAQSAKPIKRRAPSAEREARLKGLGPLLWELVASGRTRRQIAEELNRRGLRTWRGCEWREHSVNQVIAHVGSEHGFNPDSLDRAEFESRRIRALRRARAILPIVAPLRRERMSFDEIAAELNRRDVPTPHNGAWHGAAVWKLLRLSNAADQTANPSRTGA
jgi:hypothetical protein